jgi:hypothetical protein
MTKPEAPRDPLTTTVLDGFVPLLKTTWVLVVVAAVLEPPPPAEVLKSALEPSQTLFVPEGFQ